MKQRIAVVASKPASGEKGGAERLFEGLVSALNASGVQVDLLNIVSDESSFETIQESYLRFYDLDLSEYDGVISTKAPSYIIRHPNHICYLVHTMRVFYDMFESEFPEPTRDLIKHQEFIIKLDSAALSYSRTRKIFVIGNEVKQRLKKYNHMDSEVLHPSLGFNGFSCNSYEYVFTLSRLHRWKRIDLVIKAMKHVDRPLTLKIAGTGEDAEQLRELAKDDKRIVFLGQVSDQKLIDLYSNALVVPFVPEREDFGMITLEAFRSTKPVITCKDSGEPSYLVQDRESGFICPPEPEAIASKIEYLYDNPEKAKEMGEIGKESVKHITWEIVAEKLLSALGVK